MKFRYIERVSSSFFYSQQEAVNAHQTLAEKSAVSDKANEESDQSPDGDKRPGMVTPSSDQAAALLAKYGHASPEYHHILVELADNKGKLRRLRQELLVNRI
jgi:hypothetical protein